jgi:ferredoxin
MVEDLLDGLKQYMADKGFQRLDDFRGKAVPRVTDWGHLNLNYKVVARINPDTCIHCNLCHIACEDGAHQCISPVLPGVRGTPVVDEESCVGVQPVLARVPGRQLHHDDRIDDPKRLPRRGVSASSEQAPRWPPGKRRRPTTQGPRLPAEPHVFDESLAARPTFRRTLTRRRARSGT